MSKGIEEYPKHLCQSCKLDHAKCSSVVETIQFGDQFIVVKCHNHTEKEVGEK